MTTSSGWRAVPVRLTSEQIAAMQAIPIGRDLIGSKEFFDQHHAAMLAAAPSPPSAEPLQPGDEMVWRNPAPHAAPPSVPSGRYREGSIGPQQPSPPPSDALREAREWNDDRALKAARLWLSSLLQEHAFTDRELAVNAHVRALLAAPSAGTMQAALATAREQCEKIVADLERLTLPPDRAPAGSDVAAIRILLAATAPSAGSAGQADGCRIALSEIIDIWDDGKLPHEQQTYIPEALTNAIESARVELESRPEAQPETPTHATQEPVAEVDVTDLRGICWLVDFTTLPNGTKLYRE